MNESLPVSELDHLLSKCFMNGRRKNGEEYEPAAISHFQKKYPFKIHKDNEFEKSRSILAAKCKSLVHEHGKGKKPLRRLTITKKMLFLKRENSVTSIQLHLKELCGAFYPYTLVSEQEMKVVSYAGETFSFNSRMIVKKYLGLLAERGTKTRHGQKQEHQRAFQPKLHATHTERCPVSFYKKFRSRRPVQMNAPHSPFLLGGPT